MAQRKQAPDTLPLFGELTAPGPSEADMNAQRDAFAARAALGANRLRPADLEVDYSAKAARALLAHAEPTAAALQVTEPTTPQSFEAQHEAKIREVQTDNMHNDGALMGPDTPPLLRDEMLNALHRARKP